MTIGGLEILVGIAGICAIVNFVVLIVGIVKDKKEGREFKHLNFVGVHFALPPKVFGSKEVVSETVIVKLEAGTKGAETVKYDIDFYDYDLNRWSNHPLTEVEDFKVVKWATFPKGK